MKVRAILRTGLIVAALLGMSIGFEREIHKKPAGLRTHSLVCMGATLFSIVSLSFPWAMETVGKSRDLIEVNFIKSQFDTCSDRILETARTGVTNKCFFNIDRGELTGMAEGLSYKLISSTDICDPHDLTEIDEKRHIWQRCYVFDEYRVFEMLWMFPEELKVSGTSIEGSKMQGESTTGSINFTDPILFWNKVVNDVRKLDFRTLNTLLNKFGYSRIDTSLDRNILKRVSLDNLEKLSSSLISSINNNANKLNQYEYQRIKNIVPQGKEYLFNNLGHRFEFMYSYKDRLKEKLNLINLFNKKVNQEN